MVVRGHVRNGIIVPDEPGALPEGAEVRVEVVGEPTAKAGQPRQGGIWKGQVKIADGFDDLPDDLYGDVG